VFQERLVGATWTCRRQDLPTALETLSEAGFHEAEVWAEGTHLDPRVSPDLTRIREGMERHSVSIRSVHLPFDGITPDAAADDRARTWVELCTQTLDYAALVDARLAVAHPVLFIEPGEDHAPAKERLVAAVDAIGDHAQSLGIQLALENMHTMRGPTLRSVAELRETLQHMTCRPGICLDIGHAIFNGYIGDALTGEITDAGEVLLNSHIHDSDAVGRDPHLVPGDGMVDWPAALAAYRSIGYTGRHVLEVKGSDEPLSDLVRARQTIIRAMT